MKQEPKNEIDLLLRQIGRQDNSDGANDSSGAMAEDHLDADELNSYAENSLPAAARARYTSHLADCTRCRQLVSQLSLAAGVLVEDKPASIPATSGIKTFLSSLLSPMVLRYAVPALALLVVAFIGLTVFRQRATYDAFNKNVSQVQPTPSASVSPDGYFSTKHVDDLKNTPKEDSATNKVENGSPDSNARSKAGEQPASKVVDQVTQSEPPPPADRTAGAATSVAGNAPAAAPKPAVEESKERRSEDVAEKRAQVAASPQAESVEVTRDEDKKAVKPPAKEPATVFGGVASSRSGVAKTKNEKNTQPQTADAEEQDTVRVGRADSADKDNSQTRTVAGRRFRKQGSIWIDVNYDSSNRVINVTRGSEQYRALVADEPGIKTIADQLGGEVIVVWKSQTYRIR